MIVIVMGVAGSGKTTIGQLLADRLGWSFYDADSYHPAENIQKMASGRPLTDQDRWPWLMTLRELINQLAEQGQRAVLACSALKSSYREILNSDKADIRWVFLKADRDIIHERLADRDRHFMPVELVESQFAALEGPEMAIQVPANARPEEILTEIKAQLGMPGGNYGAN